METKANQAIGQLVHDVLHVRYAEQGIAPLTIRVEPLGEYTHSVYDRLRDHITQLSKSGRPLTELMESDPLTKFYANICTSMTLTALVPLERSGDAVNIIDLLQAHIVELRMRPLSLAEMLAGKQRIIELMAVPCREGELGAIGNALYYSATRALKGLQPAQKDRSRRRKYLAKALELCRSVEDTPDLPDRKALASQLGELLMTELRRSGCQNLARERDDYWFSFELFFSQTRLV